jgi:hypothetical protein
MSDRNYPSIEPKVIIEPYPKSFQALVNWLPVQNQKDDIDRPMIAHQILSYTPRFLYDFFDDKKIYITISYHEGAPDEGTFLWKINNEQIHYGGSRIEAEQDAFKEAFKILEETL